MLTAIATTKTTVLGVRLDHERRAWVETTAAEQGVTVRALIERMIDQARAGELGAGPLVSALKAGAADRPDELQSPGASASERGGYNVLMPQGAVEAESFPGGSDSSSRVSAQWGQSPCAEVAQLVSLSGQMVVGVARLTTAFARTTGDCALAPLRMLRAARR